MKIKLNKKIERALKKIIHEYEGNETIEQLVNYYIEQYILIFFSDGKDILYR